MRRCAVCVAGDSGSWSALLAFVRHKARGGHHLREATYSGLIFRSTCREPFGRWSEESCLGITDRGMKEPWGSSTANVRSASQALLRILVGALHSKLASVLLFVVAAILCAVALYSIIVFSPCWPLERWRRVTMWRNAYENMASCGVAAIYVVIVSTGLVKTCRPATTVRVRHSLQRLFVFFEQCDRARASAFLSGVHTVDSV